MPYRSHTHRISMMLLLCACCVPLAGCLGTTGSPDDHRFIHFLDHSTPKQAAIPYAEPLPRELEMVTMPEYIIEPPDILRIRLIRVVPQKPYRVGPLDSVLIQIAEFRMPTVSAECLWSSRMEISTLGRAMADL